MNYEFNVYTSEKLRSMTDDKLCDLLIDSQGKYAQLEAAINIITDELEKRETK